MSNIIRLRFALKLPGEEDKPRFRRIDNPNSDNAEYVATRKGPPIEFLAIYNPRKE